MSTITSFRANRFTAPELMNKSGYQSAAPASMPDLPTPDTSRQNVPLARGRAITLTVREDTRLRLAAGRLWITFEAPRTGPAPRNGDHFVSAGECFDLLAGESAVLEAIGPEPAACFDLEPAPALPSRAVVRLASDHPHRAGATPALPTTASR